MKKSSLWTVLSALFWLSGCGPAASPPPSVATAALDVAFNNRLRELDASGDYPTMQQISLQHQKKAPNDADGFSGEARAAYLLGDFPRAVTAYQKAAGAAPHRAGEFGEYEAEVQPFARRWGNVNLGPVRAVPGEDSAFQNRWRAQGAALIAAKKWEEIEQKAADYARTPQVFVSGTWNLTQFYVGLWNDVSDSPLTWEQKNARLQEWHRARPGSQLALVSLARSYVAGAWDARGDAPGAQVSQSQWKIVEARLAQAQPLFEQLWTQKAQTPLVFSATQRLARLSGWKRADYEQKMAPAVAQFPDFVDFHREYAIFLLPRWDGRRGDWESYATQVADAQAARRGQNAGDALYARIVWGQWDYYKNMFSEADIDWPRAQRGFEQITRESPQSLSAATIYFRLCWQAGDGPKARALLQTHIKGRADSDLWKSAAELGDARIGAHRLR